MSRDTHYDSIYFDDRSSELKMKKLGDITYFHEEVIEPKMDALVAELAGKMVSQLLNMEYELYGIPHPRNIDVIAKDEPDVTIIEGEVVVPPTAITPLTGEQFGRIVQRYYDKVPIEGEVVDE